MSSSVQIMALTATATSALSVQVEKALGMTNPVHVIQSPDRTNIRYINFEMKGNFKNVLVKELTTKRKSYHFLHI